MAEIAGSDVAAGAAPLAARPLEGRVALVTGGARGIGKAIALKLAQLGAKVAIVDLADTGADTAKEIGQAAGVATAFHKADISKEGEAKEAAAAVERALGPVDILVNNAGITRDNILLLMDEGQWDAVMAVNLKGTFLITKACLRGMIKRRRGSIVSISSVVGRRGNAGQANYSAAKAGLIGFTKSLAREVASRNVRVNAVAPGYIETEMTAALPEAARKALIEQIPLGRIGTPETVADAVAFLAGDTACFITGAVLAVDGGLGI
jgi:3-oxoacyl-[acyl-carrier protein] reductase